MSPRDRALELLTRIITGNEDADPGCTARECLVALEGLGYRPTEARPVADWRRHGDGSGPTDEWRQARAELERRRTEIAEGIARFNEPPDAT